MRLQLYDYNYMTIIIVVTIIIAVTTIAIMTKNKTTNMATSLKQVQKDIFYCLLKMLKKITKIQFVLLL